ncbi:2'-5' RNA ligase family protein [Saccharopolyspora shandongensis]|uniref:2'-5' RNA ligase family protein n=1 Tax=Saccharopolyspora shandongensis TaxID=418495 RepID=UPI003422B192
MDCFFERFPGATWEIQERLHVYALPNQKVRDVVTEYHTLLGDDPISQYGLGLQPADFLHFTVQMLRKHRSEVTQPDLDELVTHLAKQLRHVDPITLQVGPPQAGVHAVELWIAPDADEVWGELVGHTRTAVTNVFGPDALPPLGPNAVPHTSLGYGVRPGDSGAITNAIKQIRRPLVEVTVDQIHLLAVTQHPARGCFTWEPIAAIPLGH